MKEDERKFFIEVRNRVGSPFEPYVKDRPDTWKDTSPRKIGVELGIPPKRVDYLCEKWARKNLYDYGVCCDLGWLTPEGMKLDLN